MSSSPTFCLEVVEKDVSAHYYSSVYSFSIHDLSDPSDRCLELAYFSGADYEYEYFLEDIQRIRLNPFSEKPILLFYNDRRVI